MIDSSRAAAIRVRARLQPIGGAGTFVQPPTYADSRGSVTIAHHQRRIDERDVPCTLVGSVGCMANRFEEAISEMRRDGLPLSVAEVHADINGYPLHESTLTMPHRGADAIARSCLHDGTPYMGTEAGKALLCNRTDVRPLAKWHQTMLLLGGWYSARSHGGVRLPRALQAELIGIQSSPCSTVGGRYDLTPASSAVKLYRKPGEGIPFVMEGSGKGNRPSELPIGMIPSGVEERGITADYYEMNATLSLAAIRNLGCGEAEPRPLHNALRKVGVAVLLRTLSDGIYLRSRCHLVPEVEPAIELIGPDGATESLALDATQALREAMDAIDECSRAGIGWGNESLALEPSPQLAQLIEESLAVGDAE